MLPTSAFGHLLLPRRVFDPREKSGIIFPLRGERGAAMRRRVRGRFSTGLAQTPDFGCLRFRRNSPLPSSLLDSPFGIADFTPPKSAPAPEIVWEQDGQNGPAG